jgi:hypothetical protein
MGIGSHSDVKTRARAVAVAGAGVAAGGEGAGAGVEAGAGKGEGRAGVGAGAWGRWRRKAGAGVGAAVVIGASRAEDRLWKGGQRSSGSSFLKASLIIRNNNTFYLLTVFKIRYRYKFQFWTFIFWTFFQKSFPWYLRFLVTICIKCLQMYRTGYRYLFLLWFPCKGHKNQKSISWSFEGFTKDSVVSLRLRKPLPLSHWNRWICFCGLIETAEPRFCGLIDTAEAKLFKKQFSPMNQGPRGNTGSWRKNTRVENLVIQLFI